MSPHIHFSDSDRNLIASAVKKAEDGTSGEIVPVIVGSSSAYPEAYWKSMFVGIGVGLVLYEAYLMTFAGWLSGFWAFIVGLPLFVISSALLGWGASQFIPAFRRFVISGKVMDAEVHTRAIKAFVDNEVFDTRDRTGIVLLVSLFERRVEVFGDSGINSKVTAQDWSEVVSVVVSGIKKGNPTAGLVEGIERCGVLLHASGVDIRSDDSNELSNMPRFEH